MTGSLNLAAQASQTLRFAAGLARFLRTPLTASASHDLIARNLAARQANFLSIVEHAVYQRPNSPYRRLLAHAGIEQGDLRAMVAADGLEGTLERLYDAGVHVRLDEFKGREPIRRGSLAFNAGSHDFDNPLAAHHISGRSGGSRSTGTRIRLDLAHYAQDAAYEHCLLEAHGLFGRPYVLWRPAPPWTAGLKGALSHMKLGHSVARWFAQQPLTWRGPGWHHALIARTAGAISRAAGRPLPSPEHVPLDEAWRVAAWLAEQVAAGRPALLNTNPASGVRACLAAVERGFDIAGTVLRVDGEPLTPGKAAAIGKAGARAVSQYGMSEIGRIGGACAQPAAVDDVHILSDKIALIRRPPRTDIGAPILANVYTTLLPTTPKLMLNVESDDYGELENRDCGCMMSRLGYRLHLHSIRSWEKLTSEGMNFIRADLVQLVEEVLPRRFGGAATDWQLAEDEVDGLPRVEIIASPRLGPLDDATVVAAVVGHLNAAPGGSGDYGLRWREAGTLRVTRREPYATGASKILALHALKQKRERVEVPAPARPLAQAK